MPMRSPASRWTAASARSRQRTRACTAWCRRVCGCNANRFHETNRIGRLKPTNLILRRRETPSRRPPPARFRLWPSFETRAQRSLRTRLIDGLTGRNSLMDRPLQPETGREHRVLDALHRAALFCDTRIGWNRIGIALSVTIIATAAVVLYRILRTIDAGEV